MALVVCPDCGNSVSDSAQACIHCGRPMEGPITAVPTVTDHSRSPAAALQSETDDAALPQAPQHAFFPVATHKFIVLSVCTFSLYDFYWFYRNWQRIKQQTGESLSPFWRAFFGPLWNFSLLRRIRDTAEVAGVAVSWSSGLLATAYLLLTITWRLPDPWWLVGIGTFVPLLPALRTVRLINDRVGSPESLNESYSGANVATILIGGIVVLLALFGRFVPE